MAELTSPFCELRAFRAELHACLTRRADALFELVDALLSVEQVSSLPVGYGNPGVACELEVRSSLGFGA